MLAGERAWTPGRRQGLWSRRCCRGWRAEVGASAGAGFVDGDAVELGDAGLEALPDPEGEVFAGGVFEAGDFVEEAVVELVVQRPKPVLELTKVDEPAGLGVDGSADGDFDAEGVAVEAGAFVALGYVGEAVGGLEGELFGEFDDERFRGHGDIVTL